MGQTNEQVEPCVLCGLPSCLMLTIGNGKTVKLCSHHWEVWHRRLSAKYASGDGKMRPKNEVGLICQESP